MEVKKFELDISQIAYYLWIVYFVAIYSFGNVYYQLPAYLSYAMVFIMLGYKLIGQGRSEIPGVITFPATSLTVWYGFFYLWECIARLWTPDSVAVRSNTPYQTLRIVAILIAMDFYVVSKEDVRKLIKAFCIGSTVFATYILITSPTSTYGTLYYGYITGQQRNTTGYVLCFATFFLVYLYKEYKNKIWIFFSLLCFVSSLLTGSRKIIFAYAIAMFLVIIGQESVDKTIKYFTYIFLAAAIIIPIAYQIPYIRETFGERLLAVLDDSIVDSSIFYRNIAKENAIRIFKEHPAIGNGWAAVRNSFVYNGVSIYAHNNYLEIAADYGIIGCFLFFTKNFYYGIRCFFRIKKGIVFLTSTIMLISMILLDWGQVSYVYIYMMCIWGIAYKFTEYECFSCNEGILFR